MKTSFAIESTTTGFKVRAITTKLNGKTTSRLIGRTRDYEEAQVMIDDYEERVGLLQSA